MAFPLTPANNQVALVNGIEYYYNTSKGAWYRYGDVSANVITSNTFQVLSSVVFPDGTSQNSAVNPIDSYARNTANTAAANTIYTQGVDATQNSNITIAANAATAAFEQANVTAGGLTTANSRITIVEGVDITQNTRLNSIETVNVDQNTAISIIQGTDATQNVRLGSIETINNDQNTAISIIQGTDATQNVRLNSIETVNQNQNTTITQVNQFAQSAYDHANTKFASAGGVITGDVTISANNNLTVTGNLLVLGTTTTVNTDLLEINDPMILLANGNFYSDALDIGFAGSYNDGANAHTGLFRDFATKDWYLFQGYVPEVTGNNAIDINDATFRTANLNTDYVKGNLIATTAVIGGINFANYVSLVQGIDATQNTNITIATNAATGAFEQANATAGGLTTANGRMSIIEGVDATQNTNITIADTKAQAAFDKANSANVLAQAAYNQANTGGGGGGTLDQYARDTANSASSNTIIIQGVDSTQNTQIQGLQGVDIATNSAISVIQGVDLGQNTTITAVNQFAQAAFDSSNAVNGYAVSAFATANGANGLAAGAYATANTKYDSTGGTISGSVTLTGTITGNVSIATNSSAANSIGYLGVPQSNLNPMSVSYTLTIGDTGEHLYMVPSSSALTVNIPPNDSVPFPIGTAIVTVLDAAFKSNVVPQTGVTLRLAGNTAGSNVARTLSEYSMASLIKVDTNLWYISGAGVT